MSLVNQTFSSRFKDLLVINNSNAGFDTNIDQVLQPFFHGLLYHSFLQSQTPFTRIGTFPIQRS